MAGPTILIIDDDKTLVALLVHELRDAGYQVVAAMDPVQGLMSVKREAPELVLLDLMMPAGGGMPLLEKLVFGVHFYSSLPGGPTSSSTSALRALG